MSDPSALTLFLITDLVWQSEPPQPLSLLTLVLVFQTPSRTLVANDVLSMGATLEQFVSQHPPSHLFEMHRMPKVRGLIHSQGQ